ncbi:MAG: DUF615 domain-containing protein, partial [Methylotenera sp.]
MKPKKTTYGAELSHQADSAADLPPSKTQLKAEADAQQALGVRLTELSKETHLKLNLPEEV